MLRTKPSHEGTVSNAQVIASHLGQAAKLVTVADIQAPSDNYGMIARLHLMDFRHTACSAGPWILRLIQPIAGPDKVVGGNEIAGGIRNDATPSIASRTRFQRAHQAQLKACPQCFSIRRHGQKYPALYAREERNDAGKADRHCRVKSEPPMPWSNSG